MRVVDGLAAVLAIRVLVVPVLRHRPRPVQRDQRGDVFEARRRQRPQQRADRSAFQLEHTDGVAAAEHLEGLVIVEVDAIDVGPHARARFDEADGDLDDVEVPQPEEVHLEQAEVLDAVHLVLRDDRAFGDLPAGCAPSLNRKVFSQRVTGDHHRRGVDAVLAAQPFEAAGDVDHPFRIGVGGVERPELGRHLEAVGMLRVGLEARSQRLCRVP